MGGAAGWLGVRLGAPRTVRILAEIVSAFAGFECGDELADGGPEGGDGAGGDLSQQCLQLGEHLLDRTEVGRVGRQVADLCAGRLDLRAHALDLVARQVVEDDDVAGLERRHEHLSHVREEALPVDRSIEDGGRRQSVGTQGADEGGGLPMAVRNRCDEPRATF